MAIKGVGSAATREHRFTRVDYQSGPDGLAWPALRKKYFTQALDYTMIRRFRLSVSTAILLGCFCATDARADSPQQLIDSYAGQARHDYADFSGFDPARGESFFKAKHGADWSCSSCHTEFPQKTGTHAVTQKLIKPLAPSANPERFTNQAKVEKWFKRNCKDVLKRECTGTEKGDVLTWLLTVQ